MRFRRMPASKRFLLAGPAIVLCPRIRRDTGPCYPSNWTTSASFSRAPPCTAPTCRQSGPCRREGPQVAVRLRPGATVRFRSIGRRQRPETADCTPRMMAHFDTSRGSQCAGHLNDALVFRQFPEPIKQANSPRRQRDNVFSAHLHSLRRYAPNWP